MKWLAFFLFAGAALRFEVTDVRGKTASGVSISAGAPDADGWCQLTLEVKSKSKASYLLVWPFDGEAKQTDGPGGIPAIVMERGDTRALARSGVVAALAVPVVLGFVTMEQRAEATGLVDLREHIGRLTGSSDPFEKGIGLLATGRADDAVGPLNEAFKQRQRQLTRVPSEIYATAMVYGRALVQAKMFDEAAVAYLIALRQRPSDEWGLKARAEALESAGKAEAAKAGNAAASR